MTAVVGPQSNSGDGQPSMAIIVLAIMVMAS